MASLDLSLIFDSMHLACSDLGLNRAFPVLALGGFGCSAWSHHLFGAFVQKPFMVFHPVNASKPKLLPAFSARPAMT